MKIQSKFRLTVSLSLAAAFIVSGFAYALNAPVQFAMPANTGTSLAISQMLNPESILDISERPGDAIRRAISTSQRHFRSASDLKYTGKPFRSHAAGTAPVIIDEPVQTFDTYAPPPTFTPAGDMNIQSLHPVWTNDGQYILFSSNRPSVNTKDPAGLFHIWAVNRSGQFTSNSASIIQITSGPGNEDFPALDASNNTLAFVSDAKSSAVRNLYTIHFDIAAAQPVDVSNLNSLTISASEVTGFSDVQRPTWSPSGDQIAFAAKTNVGPAAEQHYHIYYLYTASNGYRPPGQGFGPNPPGKLTAGPADDLDPAWSPDARYIAFSSTATTFTDTDNIISPNPTDLANESTPVKSDGVAANGNYHIFILSSQGQVPGALATNLGQPHLNGGVITSGANDDTGPVWSQTTADGLPFAGNIAFARGATGAAPHDIYYMMVIRAFGSSEILAENAVYKVTLPGPPPQVIDVVNTVTQLDTSDPGNVYDDSYPTWAPVSVLSVGDTLTNLAYSSKRSITYNDPATGFPLEIPVSVAPGKAFDATHTLSSGDLTGYVGLFISRTDKIDPPTLLRFNGNEIVHINMGKTPVLPSSANPSGSSVRNSIPPGQDITFTVRLSDREAVNDDHRIYVQIKDPDSKYQDSNNREHKILARNSRSTPFNSDSGSASRVLYNYGIGDINYLITLQGKPATVFLPGPVGGFDGNEPLVVGRLAPDTKNIVTVPGPPPVTVTLPGTDPKQFKSYGQEYECQVVNPAFNDHGTGDTANSDYSTPWYLAGIDDTGAHSGAPGTERPGTEWLQLVRQPDDHLGGVLYSQTWKTPTSSSDYYVDVIAFDTSDKWNADNWRIYDNVWGFSTLPFDGSKGILVVSDYALGQKFAASTFENNGLANLRPTYYGAEMMYTDYDVDQLPNATDLWTAPIPPVKGVTDPVELVFPLGIGPYLLPENGLGVNSYSDGTINPSGLPAAVSQQYSLWRTLSRGAIPQDILMSFAPTFQAQPPVDLGNGTIVPGNPKVPVAPKCVLWASPYTGDLFVGPGTLADPTTQGQLAAFVAAGGRLFVSGQDVGSTITAKGQTGNTPTGTGFLPSILGATWSGTTGFGNSAPARTLNGVSSPGHRISYDAFFDPNAGSGIGQNFFDVTIAGNTLTFTYSGPLQGKAFFLSNDLYPTYLQNGKPPTALRTDASLSQVGPIALRFPSGAVVDSLIDEITPIAKTANYHQDITFGDANLGLVYNENTTTGSRVIYSSFGFEGIGLEYAKKNDTLPPGAPYYFAWNERPNLLHNIVCYLRTGTFKGTIQDTSGGGAGVVVPGATVYIRPNGGSTLPAESRGLYSATSDKFGRYQIDGVEPGAYDVFATKDGYNRASTGSIGIVYSVEGDTTSTVDLQINKISNGSINGRVVSAVDNKTGIANAAVSYTSTTGSAVSATTDANGNYSIPSVPAGTGAGVVYTGSATKDGATSPSVSVSVVTGQNITAPDMILPPAPARISGRVTELATGKNLPGVQVTITNKDTGAVADRPVTGSDGIYTSTTIPAGMYIVTSSLAGYGDGFAAANPVTLLAGIPKDDVDIVMGPVVPGTIGGMITGANGPLSGATVTITSSSGNSAGSITTSAPIAGPDGLGNINYSKQGLPQGNYTITVSAPLYITASATVTVPGGGFGRGDLTLTQTPSIATFSSGTPIFFSTPYNYPGESFDILFGPANSLSIGGRSKVFSWDPADLQYVGEPNFPADTPRAGYGYWVKLKGGDYSLRTVGTPVSSTTNLLAVGLSPGWNAIGSPCTGKVNLLDLRFPSNDPAVMLTFDQASSAQFHIVSPILYKFVPDPTGATAGKYAEVVEKQINTTTDTRDTFMLPWQGYWIRAYTNTTIYLPTVASPVTTTP